MKKLTKRAIYQSIINYAETGTMTIPLDELKTFAEKEIENLDKRANAKKKTNNDELLPLILSALSTSTFEPAETILSRIDHPEATNSKVIYRLNQLVKSNEAEKQQITVTKENAKPRKVMAYKRKED
jgi:hypothetical protein